MSILDFDDTYKPPFTPKLTKKEVEWTRPNTSKYNYAELNNFVHKEVSEDYSDEIEKLDGGKLTH